ncbi:uncharacterized protein LOC131165579 isoform X2 [Malania oleifera]|uniref:uncharacterized protein LOC131165579 isoform X2 n=1 Tax=Malania oleifera TaxID=397392 RepID=UPI0025AE687D|nr:uncharacterized protein LOC131165579 isoform X2 [Malania oleifera]
MAQAEASTEIRLKLLINKKTQKVIFAEAGKDFIDFIFSLIRLPLNGVIRLLLPHQSMVGCAANLYRSFDSLGQTYVQPNLNKDYVLKPNPTAAPPLLLPDEAAAEARPTKNLYTCGSCYGGKYVSEEQGTKCPNCRNSMNTDVRYVGPTVEGGGGYVKGSVTYMVMDDLSVSPLSMVSTIAVLNASNVGEFEVLEAKEVYFGTDEGVKLLKGSLCSNAALTYVYLGKKFVNDEASNGECVVEKPWLNELTKMPKE